MVLILYMSLVKKLIIKIWPFTVILVLIFVFYYPFFTKGLRPIPSDITVGMYYPWLNYKFPEFPVNVPVKNPLPSDVVSLTYPLRLLSIELLKNNEWPLWNTLILCGTPLLANFQSAALYPINILYLLIKDFSLAWSWQVIGQPLLGLVFCYFLLRDYKLSNTASLFGSLVWSFGSFFSIWGQYNTVIHAIVYLPLGLLCIKNLEKSNYWGVGLAVAISFSIYAGNPPMTLVLCLALMIFSIFQFVFKVKKYFKLMAFVVIGFMLALPVLLPGFNNTRLSIRQVDNVAENQKIKYTPVVNLISMVAPDVFGHPSTLNYWGSGLYDNLTIFVGVVPLILFLLNLFNKPIRTCRLNNYINFIFFLSLILYIDNPVSRFFGNLNFLGLSSMVMSRFFVLTNFSVAIGSALMLNILILNKKTLIIKLSPFLITALLIGVPLVIYGLIYSVFSYGYILDTNFPRPDDPEFVLAIKNSMIAIRNLAIPSVVFIIFVCSCWIFKNRKSLLVCLIFVLTIFDLFRFFRKYNSFTQEKYLFPNNSIIKYLQDNSVRFLREEGELMPSNMWMPYGLKSVSGYDTLHSARYNKFISLCNGDSLMKTTNRCVELENLRSDKINFLGISHLLAILRNKGVPDESGELFYKIDTQSFKQAFQDKSVVILNNLTAMPLLFSVSHYEVADDIDAMNYLIKKSDLTKTVILEKNPRIILSSKNPLISNLKIGRQKTEADIESTGSSILVTSQSYDPGWRLLIDGKESEIYTANYAFMAFVVPDGKHKIVLNYNPKSFCLGLIGASFGFVVSIGIILYTWLKRKLNLTNLWVLWDSNPRPPA